jgi:hypothetical protein
LGYFIDVKSTLYSKPLCEEKVYDLRGDDGSSATLHITPAKISGGMHILMLRISEIEYRSPLVLE